MADEGCYRLGDFFGAMKKDFKQAGDAYRMSCVEYNHGKACQKLGALHMYGQGVDKDAEKALQYFNKGCDSDAPDACLGAAVIHQQGLGADKTKDMTKAVSYLQRGCDRDNANCCFRLSTLYLQGNQGVDKDMKKASVMAVKACKRGNMYGCVNASRMYKLGDGVEKNSTLAKKYQQMAQDIHKEHNANTQSVKFGQ